MVAMAGGAIIHVVPVWHRLVAAAGAMLMAGVMPTAAMAGGAALGVPARYLDHMFVDVIVVRVVTPRS